MDELSPRGENLPSACGRLSEFVPGKKVNFLLFTESPSLPPGDVGERQPAVSALSRVLNWPARHFSRPLSPRSWLTLRPHPPVVGRVPAQNTPWGSPRMAKCPIMPRSTGFAYSGIAPQQLARVCCSRAQANKNTKAAFLLKASPVLPPPVPVFSSWRGLLLVLEFSFLVVILF